VKISELIRELTELQQEHGDVDVFLSTDDGEALVHGVATCMGDDKAESLLICDEETYHGLVESVDDESEGPIH
jgi:hypothetical protein